MIERAKWFIETAGYSVALIRPDGRVFAAQGVSVRPLYRIFTAHRGELAGAVAADKIIGRAAASLLCAAGVAEAYAFLMSEGGLKMLEAHGIKAGYARLVPTILNRTGDGLCPMEAALEGIGDMDERMTRLTALIENGPKKEDSLKPKANLLSERAS